MQARDRNYLGFLEAPEQVFVDGDWEKPRIAGTGLEDYFMGGWYFREGLFAGDLHGLPVKDALNSMAAMYRVHESDAIRFRRRFRIEFTNPFPEEARPFRHSSAAFLYLADPGGQGPPVPENDRLLCWYRSARPRSPEHSLMGEEGQRVGAAALSRWEGIHERSGWGCSTAMPRRAASRCRVTAGRSRFRPSLDAARGALIFEH